MGISTFKSVNPQGDFFHVRKRRCMIKHIEIQFEASVFSLYSYIRSSDRVLEINNNYSDTNQQ